MGGDRHSDGSFRKQSDPAMMTERTKITRWIEAETYRLKVLLALSFVDIAAHIAKVAQGAEAPAVPLPEGLVLPRDFSISHQSTRNAWVRIIKRNPLIDVETERRIDLDRLDLMWRALQAKISRGDAESIRAGVIVLRQRALLGGYGAIIRISVPPREGANDLDGLRNVTPGAENSDPITPEAEVARAREIMEILRSTGVPIVADAIEITTAAPYTNGSDEDKEG